MHIVFRVLQEGGPEEGGGPQEGRGGCPQEGRGWPNLQGCLDLEEVVFQGWSNGLFPPPS
jgi:hypothetical protein